MNDTDPPPLIDEVYEGSAHADLYALSPKDVADPPTSVLSALTKIGPGLILAASIVGTGELINTTALGAKQGIVLLWLILLSCVIKVFVQVEMGRYAITRGKTSLGAIHDLPGPRFGTSWLAWLWLAMMLATNGQLAAMEGLVGEAAVMLFHPKGVTEDAGITASIPFWATVTCLSAIALLLSGGYKRLEKITTALVALVTSVTVLGAFKASPSASQLWQGLQFRLPSGDGLTLAFSAFGITGVGASELFAYPYWCIEKGYARSAGPRSEEESWARRGAGWIRVMQLDAWFSMVVFTLATVAFYLMGSAILHEKFAAKTLSETDLKSAGMIRTLATMYTTALGSWARPFFLVSAWAVLFKTLYVATAANSRMTADFLRLAGFSRDPSPQARERLTRVFCVIYPILSLAIFLTWREPLFLISMGGAAQGLMLPLIAGATLYLRYRDADKRVGPGVISDVFSWLAFGGIAAVAIYTVYGWMR